MDKIVIWAFTR